MRKHRISHLFFVFMLLGQFSTAQLYRMPLDTVMMLSGTFGEMRGNHFHAGIDFKTFEKTHLPVYSAESGFVSRIKISHGGYGKAIYINHPDGRTTVYGHLSKFSAPIEAYIRKNQYRQRNPQIELFPPPTLFRLKKGELIAYSGNTGSSTGPHLHFEVRDTKTEDILNPLLGFIANESDSFKPKASVIQLVARDRIHKWKEAYYPVLASLSNPSENQSLSFEVPAGEYGWTIGSREYFQPDTQNILGVYHLMLKQGDLDTIYNRQLDRFSFKNARNYQVVNERIWNGINLEATFKEQWQINQLGQYKQNGWWQIKQGEVKSFTLLLADEAGNQSIYQLEVKGLAPSIPAQSILMGPSDQLVFKQKKSIAFANGAILDFYNESFIDTVLISVRWVGDTMVILPEGIQASQQFRISLPISDRHQKSFLGIASNGDKGKWQWLESTETEKAVWVYTKQTGRFFIVEDKIPPAFLEPEIDHNGLLSIQIVENGSGIAKYDAFINDRWFLMELDTKTNTIQGDLAEFAANQKLNLRITVSDFKGNINTLEEIIVKP